MKDHSQDINIPEFREIGRCLDGWAESRFDHKKNSDKVVRMAVSLGLEKEFQTDARIAFAFLRGWMACQKAFRGMNMP